MKTGVYIHKDFFGNANLILVDNIFKNCYSGKYERYEISMVTYYDQTGVKHTQKARLVAPIIEKLEYLGKL